MKNYLKKLASSIKDDNDMATELYLAWIAIMLTGIFLFIIVGYVFG